MARIIHCITTIERGGAENQLLILVEEQIKNGHDVTIIYLKGQAELESEFVKLGAKVSDLVAKKNPLIQLIILNRYLKKYSCILHAHLPRAELICALTKHRNTLIITKHNAEKFFPGSPPFVSRFFSRLVMRKANRCICISRSVLNYLFLQKEIISSDKYAVIYYGIGDDLVESALEFNHDLKFHRFKYFGTIGRIVPQKDYPTLLKSFSKFNVQNNEPKLLVVGDGILKNDMEALANQLRIDSSVIWLGKLSSSYDLLINIDLFVLSSKYEGFGLVLLEAMVVNTPIVAAGNPAVLEVLGEEYPGLFIPGDENSLYDQMIKSSSIEYRTSLVFAAQNRLKLFKSSLMYEKTNSLYNSADYPDAL